MIKMGKKINNNNENDGVCPKKVTKIKWFFGLQDDLNIIEK